jgi:hypothetical protein
MIIGALLDPIILMHILLIWQMDLELLLTALEQTTQLIIQKLYARFVLFKINSSKTILTPFNIEWCFFI